jgi:hypothetical protein
VNSEISDDLAELNVNAMINDAFDDDENLK